MSDSIKLENQWPLVSLVITSYNRADMIHQAIESALAQNYPNLEIIISDNASIDHTDEVISRYLHDSRIKYFKNERNIGMLPNFAKATNELAQGKYITYVSSDDYLINNTFISEAVEKFNSFPNLLIVQGVMVQSLLNIGVRLVSPSYAYYREDYYSQPFVSGKKAFMSYAFCPSVTFGGAIFSRNVLVEREPFVQQVLLADAEVILQLLLLGDVAFMDKETYVATSHSGNATGLAQARAKVYIDNLEYVEPAYALALEKRLFSTEQLDSWRFDLLFQTAARCFDALYMTDKKEFFIFSEHLNQYYPALYKRITSRTSWYFLRVVYANQSVGKLYSKLRLQLGRLKRLLISAH